MAGFLQNLRDLTTRHAALLIFDEVISGFRVCYGGAQTVFGIAPDLTRWGKLLEGDCRLPRMGTARSDGPRCAARSGVSGRNAIWKSARDECGNCDARFACRSRFYESLDARAKRLGDGIAAVLRETGASATAARVGSLLTLFFSGETVRDYAGAKKCDTRRFATFFRAMLDRGVFLAPSQFEALFVSSAHSDADIDRTISAFRESLASAMESS